MAGAVIPLRPAKWSSTFPAIQNVLLDTTNGATVVPGMLVYTASDGEVDIFLGGTNAVVLGVALGDFQGAAGYGMPNSPSQVTYRANTVPVAIANTDTIFEASIYASAAAVDPATTNIGESYGTAWDATNKIWYVDKDEVTTKIFHIVGIDTERKTVFVKFLSAVCETLL